MKMHGDIVQFHDAHITKNKTTDSKSIWIKQ